MKTYFNSIIHILSNVINISFQLLLILKGVLLKLEAYLL